jgi:hypothetical protein
MHSREARLALAFHVPRGQKTLMDARAGLIENLNTT